MLRQYRIRTRLIALIVIPLITLIALQIMMLSRMANLNAGINSLYQDRIVPLSLIKNVSDGFGIDIVDAIHKYRGKEITLEQLAYRVNAAKQTASNNWKEFLNTQLTPEEARLADAANKALTPVFIKIDEYLDLAKKGGLQEMAPAKFIPELYETFDPLTSSLNALINLQLNESEKFTALARNSFYTMIKSIIIFVALLFIGLCTFGYLIYKSINAPLESLEASMLRISSNSDLTIQIPQDGNDEITHLSVSFATMMNNFRTLIQQLRDSVDQTSTAAEEMSSISRQVSTTVKEQEDHLAMVATAMTEMSGAVKEVANSANETSAQANDADKQAKIGQEKIDANLKAINTLSVSVNDANQVIHTLHSQSGKISEVLTVIRNIAEQTNLLALNAAIESARAGEAGRGFAVVADEVRNLARSTQDATMSIGIMIEHLQSAAQQAVQRMDQANKEALDSVIFAKESGDILQSIANAVNDISNMNFQVSTATEEQSQVADEINDSINRFSLTLGSVSDNAHQSAVASEQIARLSSDLQHQISIFRA